ncbi:bifunctional pantoate--beta-alanine ligase/(d)CMP kinase [Alkalinema sp. FACHB-956]|uniref:bifunctional pantoate--beta-alanine ligase/(d)CMP kinase n=1 Tax=Alkalinema sp. FACHB-956 TaxID=2692768 RepID=UPI001682EA6F|nr:bifunctional pantoate--beta-alanine ligase/(d)CMP kinase [Alkalinema sp. FACHB-956]
MRLFTTVAALRCYLAQCRKLEGTVGLVPTMGALHAGHQSLIDRARQENQWVVVTIFVNPLQFGPNEDFDRYPRTLEADRALCEAAGVDVIFAPPPSELGIIPAANAEVTQIVPPAAMQSGLCGASRPGHFNGVATIVTKLLNLVQPDRAYFGQKDAQQLAIIQQLVADLNLSVEIVACPIVREPSGLALSSRNQYLSPAEKQEAVTLSQGLMAAQQEFRRGERQRSLLIDRVKAQLATAPNLQPEYIELVDPTTLTPLTEVAETGLLTIAARLGKTRLIDNVLLRTRKPIVAIDGPAGAGKSTVTKQVAQALELFYLDTGAMYRAITWLVLQSGISVTDEPAIAELVFQCHITLTDDRVEVNGQEVTQAIRTPEVTSQVSTIAAQTAVRQALVKQQREYGKRGGVVLEGRDIGTHVFPDAELKIFLTATVAERARRRQKDLERLGQPVPDLEELVQLIAERDAKDSTRSLAPLCQAIDAVELVTDGMTIETVVNQIITLYHNRP